MPCWLPSRLKITCPKRNCISGERVISDAQQDILALIKVFQEEEKQQDNNVQLDENDRDVNGDDA